MRRHGRRVRPPSPAWTLLSPALPLLLACQPAAPKVVDEMAGIHPDDEIYLYEETDVEPDPSLQFAELEQANDEPYVLLGTLVIPDRVFEGGLLVEDGRIEELWEEGEEPAIAAGVESVDTGGIILPGLIDLHNHVTYNFLPFWRAGRTFLDRYEWAGESDYKAAVRDPYNALLDAGLSDEMVKFGEIRGLVGGTTSILGAKQTTGAGILARNIDQKTLGSDLIRTHVLGLDQFLCRGCSDDERRSKIADLIEDFEEGATRAMFLHIAEGIDPALREEFEFLEEEDLLRPEIVVTHGTALVAEDFEKMGSAGMSLVWSPRSNLELYGATTDVETAFEAGVRIALAPDWSPSGSDNLLAELRYVERYNRDELGGFFSPRQLVEMATSAPAAIAGREGHLGTLEPRAFADLLVLERLDPDPYASILRSDERHVRLVTVNGVPLHGFPSFLERLGKVDDFEELRLRGRDRALDADVDPDDIRNGGQSFEEIEAFLAAAYAPFGELPGLTANDP